MVLGLTIGGVAKQIKSGSLNISETANGMATARFTVISTDGTYRPAFDAEVLLTVDGTLTLGGHVDRPSEKGLASGARPGIETAVTVTDFNQYPQRRVIPDHTFEAGTTMKDVLEYLTDNYLDIFGVSLHASQVDGPALPKLEYKNKTAAFILNDVATLSGTDDEPMVWRISPTKVLRMYQPSTVAAPFDITTNTPSQVVGDITIEITPDGYANRVYVQTASKTEAGHQESFTGDGVTTTFQLQYTPTGFVIVLVGSGGGETIAGVGDGGMWEYDPATNQATRVVGPTVNGETYTFYFVNGTYNGQATAEDASADTNPWERVIAVDAIPDNTTAQAFADAELAKRLTLVKKVKYRTFESGLAVGQSQTINVPRRNINAMGVITDIVTNDFGKDRLTRDVTVLFDSQTNVGRSYRDTVRGWNGDTTGSTATAKVSPTIQPTMTGGAAPPDKAVQFNKSPGVFGGSAEFTFDYLKQSLVCGGGGSSITATDFQSCQVFGYDCHIADP